MRNPKREVPLVIIDTRNKGLKSMQDDRLRSTENPKEAEATFGDLLPLFFMVIQKMWMTLQGPLKELNDRIIRLLKTKVFRKDLPWFKIGVLSMVAFIMLKKDFQLNFAVASPLSVFTDDRDAEKESNLSQSLSVANPYAPLAADDLQDRRAKKFIRAHAELAQKEMKKFGIPASIKMAQALIESRAGTSRLAENNNNFFGMKCFSRDCKKGHCSNATDDHHKDFFRIYKKPIDSWRAHSQLISNGRYAHLKSYDKDYKKWAVGLKKAGYATDKRYHQKLINTIEKYQLYRLDQ